MNIKTKNMRLFIKNKGFIFLLFIILLVSFLPPTISEVTASTTEVEGLFKKKKKKKEEQSADTLSAYDKLTQNSSKQEGLFSVYKKEKDYYFEIPVKLLDRDLLVVNKLQRVPAELNEAGVNKGVNYEKNYLISFGCFSDSVVFL